MKDSIATKLLVLLGIIVCALAVVAADCIGVGYYLQWASHLTGGSIQFGYILAGAIVALAIGFGAIGAAISAADSL